MRATPATLPCTPLEVPMAEGAGGNYLDYWTMQLEADRRLCGARDLDKLAHAGSAFVRDPEDLQKVPALVPKDKRTTAAGIIEIWSRGLGSFNHLVDGTGDLLRGAGIILGENQQGSAPCLPVVRKADPTDVVDAFLDVADSLEVERQRPSHALMVAGQLVHQAAWTEQDTSRQADLFSVADDLYGRVYEDDNVAWGEDKINAAGFRADIRFHALSRRIRQATRAKQDMKPYQEEAVCMLRGQIRDLFEVQSLVDNSSNERTGKSWGGTMLELFSTIAVRDDVFVRSPLKGNHPEIRTAFTREDEPLYPRERRVESSFDCVIDRVTSNGKIIKAIPVQLKQGDGLSKCPRPYHPAIQVVTVRNIGSRIMAETGRSMLDDYNRHQATGGARALRLVQTALEPYLGDLKAA